MVVTGKLIISQTEIIDITNKDIIKILDFDKIMSNVIVVGKKVMSSIIVMYGKKIIKEEDKNSKLKVGVNVAMVKKDQPIVNVCVTTRRQRVRILEADMHAEGLLEKEVSPTKGHRIKWEKDKLIQKDVVNELQRIQ